MRRLTVARRCRLALRTHTSTWHWKKHWALLGLVLMVVTASAGCADDSENRSFANDPRTPVEQPTEPATPVTQTGTNAIPALPSPESLVRRRGAPATIYIYADGALRSLSGDTWHVVAEGGVAAFAASPGGSHVAVVTSQPTDDSEIAYSISIYSPVGEVTQTFENVIRVTLDAREATPPEGDSPERPQVDISWAAQGGRILLTHSSGKLIDIPLDGEPHEIRTATPIAGAFEAAWSPRGDTIGVLMREDDGLGEMAMLDTSVDPAKVTVIGPAGGSPDGARSVEAFEWKANGSGVFYLEMRRTQQGLLGGTILGWDRLSNSTMIVATGGQSGPAGSVTWFSVSPDGNALAYRVALPGDDGWSFNGLFVRALESGQVYRLPVAPNASVTGAWWYSGGLVWSQVTSNDDQNTSVEVVITDVTGEQTQLASFSLAAPATPVVPGASPVRARATPGATPASDRATPVASPAATPLASPAATPAG